MRARASGSAGQSVWPCDGRSSSGPLDDDTVMRIVRHVGFAPAVRIFPSGSSRASATVCVAKRGWRTMTLNERRPRFLYGHEKRTPRTVRIAGGQSIKTREQCCVLIGANRSVRSDGHLDHRPMDVRQRRLKTRVIADRPRLPFGAF